jgi:hypothetical protein
VLHQPTKSLISAGDIAGIIASYINQPLDSTGSQQRLDGAVYA